MEGDGKKMTLKPIRIISKNLDENGGGEEAILLSPITRMFHEPGYKFYILAIMGWKVPIDVDSIKAELQRKMLKHPRFSSLQVMDKLSHDGNGEMRWVPTTVNIDDHIILPQIAHNNMDDADKLVEQYISNLSTTTIDMSKPLWDFHVLNMKTSRTEATCIFRFHHSLGDGVALISLLLSCFQTTSDPTSLPTIPVSSSKDKSNLSISNSRNNILSLMWKYLVKLWLFIKLLFNTIIDLFLITATMLFLKDSRSPFTIAHVSNRQTFIYRTVSLDDIKFIKKETNTTVNDVILGITQAALSRYINRSNGKRKFGKRMRCRAAVTVNLRPTLGVQVVAEMIEKNTTVVQGNCFGLAIFPLNITQLENSLDYVHKAKRSMDRKKHSLATRCTFNFIQLIFKLFGCRAATTFVGRVLSQTTLLFSNVAGPLEQVSLAGHPLAFLAPTCYGQPTGLLIHACSYANQLTFAVAVDEGLIPDPNQLGDDFIDSFMLIKEAALTKSRTNIDV